MDQRMFVDAPAIPRPQTHASEYGARIEVKPRIDQNGKKRPRHEMVAEAVERF